MPVEKNIFDEKEVTIVSSNGKEKKIKTKESLVEMAAQKFKNLVATDQEPKEIQNISPDSLEKIEEPDIEEIIPPVSEINNFSFVKPETVVEEEKPVVPEEEQPVIVPVPSPYSVPLPEAKEEVQPAYNNSNYAYEEPKKDPLLQGYSFEREERPSYTQPIMSTPPLNYTDHLKDLLDKELQKNSDSNAAKFAEKAYKKLQEKDIIIDELKQNKKDIEEQMQQLKKEYEDTIKELQGKGTSLDVSIKSAVDDKKVSAQGYIEGLKKASLVDGMIEKQKIEREKADAEQEEMSRKIADKLKDIPTIDLEEEEDSKVVDINQQPFDKETLEKAVDDTKTINFEDIINKMNSVTEKVA